MAKNLNDARVKGIAALLLLNGVFGVVAESEERAGQVWDALDDHGKAGTLSLAKHARECQERGEENSEISAELLFDTIFDSDCAAAAGQHDRIESSIGDPAQV
jgi:hypothetical protein